MQIKYGNHFVKRGTSFSTTETTAEPQLINPPSNTTIFLIDPKGPDQPFLHWALYIDPNGQREILHHYREPTPPSGIHTYIFYTYPGRYNETINQYPFIIPNGLTEVGSFTVMSE